MTLIQNTRVAVFLHMVAEAQDSLNHEGDPRHHRQLRQPQTSQGARMVGPASRWTFRFTPTSASWLNAVEGFFAKLARRRLKRGVFRSVDDLKAAIDRFVTETNADPKPFVWTANPKLVLVAIKREKRQSTSAAVAAAGVYSAGNTAWIFRPVRSICSRRIRVASRVRRSIIAWAMAVCSAGTSRSG